MFALTAGTHAAQPANPPGLPPTQVVRPLLEADPRVTAARAGLEVGRQEANILDRSPYEWTPSITGQRRRIDTGSRYNEWNIGIERTIRLPGKATADRNIGGAAVEVSRARHGEALQEVARDFIGLWVDWLAAEQALELATRNLESVQENLAVVEKRSRAGDASKLDASIARAELAEQRRLHNDAKTQASAAWLRLSTRFPTLPRQIVPLPMPLIVGEDAAFWRQRILAESDELKVAEAEMRLAQANAERARADRTPDPTLGVFTASEFGNQERILGLAISIPIPGSRRDASSAKAIAAVEVSRHEAELVKRRLEAEVASAVATARGAYDSLSIANEGTTTMSENARLMQRAYSLGEAELQALLLARRQATAAANNALQAQVTALKAYYGLLVDAHLIWDLAHD
ncbi:MAG: TolC family protein [Burkholderiales bacterium]|nr:TolC family protein [Burkholderiales bacterium]